MEWLNFVSRSRLGDSMKSRIVLPLFSALLGLSVFTAFAAEEDLRTLVRGGCPDESNCCFGKWKVKTAAPAYQTDDAIDKVGAIVAGEEVEASSGRVHTEPGKLKVVFKHGEWKAGQTIGLYTEVDEHDRARVGTASNTKNESLSFIKRGSKCAKPSKDCWATLVSHPKMKWMIKVKLPEDRSGWVDAVNVATDSECKL